MSAGKKSGGYTSVVYSTASNFATSTSITGLWSGTQIGEAEITEGQDSAGRTVQTGVRVPGEIFTTAVTAAFITNIIAAASACTELYFRYYYIGGGHIQMGPHTVRVGSVGAAPGEVHRVVIRHDGFTEDILDQQTFN